jgi:Gram-negative bacterial TonB protein C-terminal/PilZ domain
MGSLQEHFGTLPPAPDRRCETRTTPASLARVEFGNDRNGIILNISQAGMAVAVAHVLAVGELLSCVRFQLPSSGRGSVQSVEISAEIVWLSESRKGAGMRFLGLSADARGHISNWIALEKRAPDFEHLPKPVLRDKRPLEISSSKSRMIFSGQPIRDDEAGARYARMFPSENAYPKITATLDEIKTEPEPPSCIHSAADVTTRVRPAEISVTDIVQSTVAAFPRERNEKSAAKPLETSNPNKRKQLTPDKPEAHTPDNNIELSPARVSDSPLNSGDPEKSAEKDFKLQFAMFGFVLVAISFILGLTAGYAPIEKRLRSLRKPAPPLVAVSPAPPIVEPPVESSPPDSGESEPESPPAPSHPRPSSLATHPAPAAPSLPTSRIGDDSDSLLKTHKLGTPHLPEANLQKKPAPSELPSAAFRKNPNPSTTLESNESKPTVKPKNQSEERDDSTGSAAESSAPTARPKPDEPASPPPAAASTHGAPRDPVESSATPQPSPTPTPNLSRPAPVPIPANVAIPPTENGKLVRAVFPRKAIDVSPSLAITSQLSVLIAPAERSTAGDRETARLQAGELISYVVPRQPRPGYQYTSTETVRVHVTIGSDGRVMDVKPLNGPIFLLSSVTSAVRQWRFHPTLLNGAPVKAEDDVTIEFRLKR